MIRELKTAPLLLGYRGAAPADVPAVEDLLQRISTLADEIPEIAELDLNPVIVDTDSLITVDAKIRLAPDPRRPRPPARPAAAPTPLSQQHAGALPTPPCGRRPEWTVMPVNATDLVPATSSSYGSATSCQRTCGC